MWATSASVCEAAESAAWNGSKLHRARKCRVKIHEKCSAALADTDRTGRRRGEAVSWARQRVSGIRCTTLSRRRSTQMIDEPCSSRSRNEPNE